MFFLADLIFNYFRMIRNKLFYGKFLKVRKLKTYRILNNI